MHRLVWSLESAFDQDNPRLLERMKLKASPETLGLIELLLDYQEKKYAEVLARADLLIQQNTDSSIFGFCMQFAVAATETVFDESLRTTWIGRWKQNPEALQDPYCRFLQIYHLALTNFFEGKLSEAEGLFAQALDLSRRIDYARGEMRILYHLGLVAKERGNSDEASDRFQLARALASKNNSQRLLRVIAEKLGSAENQQAVLMSLVLEKKWKLARQLYLRLEKARRREGKHRQAESLYIYLAILCFAQGKRDAFARIKNAIEDPVILENLLVLKKDLFTLTANETAELDYIRTVLGKDIDKRENEIAGVALHALPSEDIARFVRILTQSRRPVSKEIICKALWNLQYDPSIHDGRLYKLVHHTRRAFPKNDVVLNEYGSYRINPIYQTQGA